MQFRWNHTQGAPDYDRETGFGFVTGAVYNADAGLHIPETNSGFLPLWWYAGTPISDIRQSEYGLQATAAAALRGEDAADRRLPVWLRIQVPGEGVYRAEITVTGTDGGEVLVFTGRHRLVWRGVLPTGAQQIVTAYCDVFPIVPRGQADAVASDAVNIAVVGGASGKRSAALRGSCFAAHRLGQQ